MTTMRSALATTSSALFIGLLAASACTDDGAVLWKEDTDGSTSGETGAAVTAGSGVGGGEMTTSSVGGNGADGGGPFPVGGSGPNPTPICTEDWEPVCECLPATLCSCSDMGSPPMGPCQMSCSEGDCEFRCGNPEPCENECAHSCDMTCESGSTCTLGCAQGGCTMVCEVGSFCTLWSWDAPSQMYCAAGAVCDCYFEDNCNCTGPGCP